MTITTPYQGFRLVFRESEGFYRVHDPYGVQGIADHRLHIATFASAKAYVDALVECMTNPAPEPEQSHRLEPFYRCGHRDDGPFPALLGVTLPDPHAGCRHMMYLPQRGGWGYCGKKLKPGSTRCWDHERKYAHIIVPNLPTNV